MIHLIESVLNGVVLFVGPLMLTALSVPFLKEKVGPRRWAAVLIGFGASLVIIRPGWGMAQPAALLPQDSMKKAAGEGWLHQSPRNQQSPAGKSR